MRDQLWSLVGNRLILKSGSNLLLLLRVFDCGYPHLCVAAWWGVSSDWRVSPVCQICNYAEITFARYRQTPKISISNQTGQLNLGVRWGVISQEGKSRVSNLQLQIRRYKLQTDTEISDIAYQCSTFNSDTTHSFQEN